jgi:hypothetical protein
MQELLGVKEREAAGFTSALRETFKTIVFPMRQTLRLVGDFRMEFDGNDYSGEQQIVDTLAKRGKLIPSDRQSSRPCDSTPRISCSMLMPSSSARSGEMRRCGPPGFGCRAAVWISWSKPRCSAASGATKTGWLPKNGNAGLG